MMSIYVTMGMEMETDENTIYEMGDQAAHTPCPGTTTLRCEKLSVMTVVHTPLLGPASVHTPPGGTAVCKTSGAGFKASREDQTEISVRLFSLS